MKTHDLKVWPAPFAGIDAGLKPWEFRLNDRNFKVGDRLCLREYDPRALSYTGRTLDRFVVYVLDGGFGLPPGYVIMTLAEDSPTS